LWFEVKWLPKVKKRQWAGSLEEKKDDVAFDMVE